MGISQEEYVGSLTKPQHTVIDQIIDAAVQLAYSEVHSLYLLGLFYLGLVKDAAALFCRLWGLPRRSAVRLSH